MHRYWAGSRARSGGQSTSLRCGKIRTRAKAGFPGRAADGRSAEVDLGAGVAKSRRTESKEGPWRSMCTSQLRGEAADRPMTDLYSLREHPSACQSRCVCRTKKRKSRMGLGMTSRRIGTKSDPMTFDARVTVGIQLPGTRHSESVHDIITFCVENIPVRLHVHLHGVLPEIERYFRASRYEF
jgi:hypothetical protein